ncbi:MAG TPA: hypothetical protein VFB78_19020 [Acidimicrobiales bacterium]|nr:hypothetical protein [Acidimicrobiales bacterium]
MRWRFASIPWDEVGPALAMVTLTYPAQFPADGRKVKRDMDVWRSRWHRRWGEWPKAAWALEFQRRGAPHVHLYMGRPAASSVAEFRAWCLSSWFEVVGSDDIRHLTRGVHVQPCRFDTAEKNAMRVADYFWKHHAKASKEHYQKRVPEGYEYVGRFWGVWGVKPREYAVELSKAEYVAVRRPLLKLRAKRSRSGRARMPNGLNGLWVLSEDGLDTGTRLISWATSLLTGNPAPV